MDPAEEVYACVCWCAMGPGLGGCDAELWAGYSPDCGNNGDADLSCTTAQDEYDMCTSKPIVDGEPVYFTVVSKDLRQPVFSGVRVEPCTTSKCYDQSRGCHSFQTCCINGVTHNDFTGSGVDTTDLHIDRGHQVPSGLVARHFAKSISTFSMCNIGPQSMYLNEADWVQLEHLLQCVTETYPMTIFAGPLFSDALKQDEA
eukprot:scaffold1885_cov402-Prasinococcus_capsulatus_cf.AAC.15